MPQTTEQRTLYILQPCNKVLNVTDTTVLPGNNNILYMKWDSANSFKGMLTQVRNFTVQIFYTIPSLLFKSLLPTGNC